ncbi:MAG: ankyrin repeat domain-containing protein [Oscillatoriales cyanobacterium C42_A2020_001]|nr:ankyrin repeat domain-containing protein [Leptolyngbyaceae cyanobacterium C42_A2020_001]
MEVKRESVSGEWLKDQPVHELARSGNVEALRDLLDRDPQLALAKSRFNCIPLHFAAESGSVECVQLLIEHMTRLQRESGVESLAESSSQSAIVNVPESLHANTPLFGAVLDNSLDCARLLLEHGANPNARSSDWTHHITPLFYVRSLEMLLLLEKYGADLDVESSANQYAFEACGWKSFELLQFWLNRGVNVNHAPGFGAPLLHTVVGLCKPNGHTLSEVGYVSLLGPDGKPIAHPGWVSLLLDSGADPNFADKDEGNTPLHIAVLAKRCDVARLLLDRGANPNAQNYIGDTPLHQATKKGEFELTQLLIEYGADVNLRNLPRISAWDNAQKFPELLTILQPYWLNLPNPRPTPEQLVERILAISAFGKNGLMPCSEIEIYDVEQRFGSFFPKPINTIYER